MHTGALSVPIGAVAFFAGGSSLRCEQEAALPLPLRECKTAVFHVFLVRPATLGNVLIPPSAAFAEGMRADARKFDVGLKDALERVVRASLRRLFPKTEKQWEVTILRRPGVIPNGDPPRKDEPWASDFHSGKPGIWQRMPTPSGSFFRRRIVREALDSSRRTSLLRRCRASLMRGTPKKHVAAIAAYLSPAGAGLAMRSRTK